jgi:hypothetical protein
MDRHVAFRTIPGPNLAASPNIRGGLLGPQLKFVVDEGSTQRFPKGHLDDKVVRTWRGE